MDLVLFGIQGSGKGTQAKRLVAEFNFHFFEAGGTLRAIAAEDSHLASQVRSYINAGHLVPHEIIMEVVREKIVDIPPVDPILFDGIPRDANQKRDFDIMMTELKREFFCVNILLTEERALERIKRRATEQSRVDDSDAVKIKRRIQIFMDETTPVIEAYRKAGKLIDVDGEGTVDEVYSRLAAAVRKRL
ncbi:MAG TPA: nucleoside monophosphate kinase [Candidatus Peribacteraceae bacterium]|nr:nucleoside monophosphate kinase [Candidatus Peribacteraceae bacterium]